ncbi:DUF2931 family protein [Flavobacterium sp. MC2016-06]|jgi:hypothetical protein|uniref:DUF2931 family protein n=1 Tax=Flavobacterium sp. MC2016-06 TaxID=2676308 RepID=UPI0012BAFAC3|nr:DUF2931 family protein [Flavobacterium sp. MC2016-06]MBU3858759.1 DUF2931 family protein [Flavobacterium sp. MC2016-06]
MEKENKHNDLTNKLLALLLIVTVIVNGIQYYYFKGYERYDWIGSVISTEGNIIQVSDCNFKGYSGDIDKNMILNNGWDKTNEPENKTTNTFFPDSLSLKWFSYSEQKFYSGNFALPKETIQSKAIQMGMYPSIKNDYETDRVLHFIAEIQPKGKLAVWIQKFNKNDNDKKIKIGTYQATEISATWHIFDDRSESDVNSDIDISRKVALVLEQHCYKVEIKLPDGYTLRNSSFEFFNQKTWYFRENDSKEIPVFNFLPKEFDLEWGNGKKKFRTQFSFDENEVLDNFSKDNNGDISELPILELVVSDYNNDIKAMLKNTKTNSKVKLIDKYRSNTQSCIISLAGPYND